MAEHFILASRGLKLKLNRVQVMNKKIRLSIILPCYNVAKYISACFDSLYCQDIPTDEYEVIAINDCSSDNTEQIIINYQKKYENLILINHSVNLKAGGARNTGFNSAKGSYIWFVDPDDFIKLNIFNHLLTTAEQLDLDILSFNYYRLKDCNITSGDEISFYSNIILDGKIFFSSIINKWWQNGYPWRRIYSRVYLLKSNIYFRERVYHEDQVYSLATVYNAKRIIHVDKEYYYYRFNTNSTTNAVIDYLKYYSICQLASDLLCFSKDVSSDLSINKNLEEVALYNFNLVMKPLFFMNKFHQKKIIRLLFLNKEEIKKSNYFRGWRKLFFINIALTSYIILVVNKLHTRSSNYNI